MKECVLIACAFMDASVSFIILSCVAATMFPLCLALALSCSIRLSALQADAEKITSKRGWGLRTSRHARSPSPSKMILILMSSFS